MTFRDYKVPKPKKFDLQKQLDKSSDSSHCSKPPAVSPFEIGLLLSPHLPDVYVCDTGDSDSSEIRLQVVTSNATTQLDLPIKEMFQVGAMIIRALQDRGYCSHGNFQEDCHSCMIRDESTKNKIDDDHIDHWVF